PPSVVHSRSEWTTSKRWAVSVSISVCRPRSNEEDNLGTSFAPHTMTSRPPLPALRPGRIRLHASVAPPAADDPGDSDRLLAANRRGAVPGRSRRSVERPRPTGRRARAARYAAGAGGT